MRGQINKLVLGCTLIVIALIWGAQTQAATHEPKGKLVVAVTSLHEESPHPFRQTAGGMTQHLSHLCDSLTRWNHEGKEVPAIAESWKIADGGNVWEFKLRDGVRFHNGQILTTEDVKFSIEAILNPEFKHTNMSMLRRFLDKIEVVDKLHFKVYTKVPVAMLPDYINAWIAPKEYYERLGEKEFSQKPVAAGPFKYVTRKPSDSLELEAFKDFYDSNRIPHTDKLIFKIIPDVRTKMAAFQAGEVDIIDQVPSHSINEVKTGAGFKVFVSPYSGYSELTFTDLIREGASPVKDKRVRQALLYAIDRQTIIKRLYFGEAAPQVAAGFLPHIRGYDPSLKPQPYDLDKAKALLAEAGYANGFSTEITYFDSPAVPAIPDMMEAVGSYWSKIGVKATLTKLETGAAMAKFREKTLPGIPVLAGMLGRDVGVMAEGFFQTGGPWSYWSNAEMDGLLTKHMAIMDPQKRNEHLHKVMKLVYEELPRIPLLSVNAIAGGGPKVVDWKRIPGSPYLLNLESVVLKD